MSDNDIKIFNKNVTDSMLSKLLPSLEINVLNRTQRRFYYIINALLEFYETRNIPARRVVKKNPIKLSGSIGTHIKKYIDYRVHETGISPSRRDTYEKVLLEFQEQFLKDGLKNIIEISSSYLIEYLNIAKTDLVSRIQVLRGFFRFLFQESSLLVDLSIFLPQVRTVNQPKLPSHYSPEEIDLLLKTIDRSNPIGKRDYAMVLIAARLGLRASDIINLKFENLIWEQSTIKIIQMKTEEAHDLPLLPDVGNAIIEYLKYGRRQTSEPYIFLSVSPPYKRFAKGCTINHIFRHAFARAGINTEGKRKGPHSLRHSFAQQVMYHTDGNLEMVRISLGQTSLKSAMYYTRIDFNSLESCAIEVEGVNPIFYQQKGNWYYGR